MSHKVTLKTKIKNMDALKRALDNLRIAYQLDRDVRFYNSYAHGLAFQLPDWHYPTVVTDSGEIVFDNYNGVWGKQAELTKVIAEYAAEVAQEQAWAMGWQVNRTVDAHGNTVITMSADGGSW